MYRWLNGSLTRIKKKPLLSRQAARTSSVTRLLRPIRANSSSLVQHQSTTPVHCTWQTVWPTTLKEVTRGFKERTGLLPHCVVWAWWQRLQPVCTLLPSHRLCLESFGVYVCLFVRVRVCAASSYWSINKQNSPLLHAHSLFRKHSSLPHHH